MARARNIKPGFFDNEVLGELNPLTRLLFIGLWCIADRKGRLEDRPLRIKKEILGYDDCDCDALLHDLCDNGFIERYSVDGKNYIQITNFVKHQKPHQNEKESEIPPSNSPQNIKDLLPRYEASTTLVIGTRADSLNSDSLNSDSLNSDSLNSPELPRTETVDLESELIDFSDDLRVKVKEWLEYKKERRESYKARGLRAFLSQIESKAKEFGDNQVIFCINESMANNYQGVMWNRLRAPDKKYKPPNNLPRKESEEYDWGYRRTEN